MSKITLKNSNGQITLENPPSNTVSKTVDISSLDGIKIFDTVEQITNYIGSDGDVIHLSDIDRGGIFIYDSTSTDNGGTVFGKCVRQFSGAVDIKWFDARSTTISENAGYDSKPAIQKAVEDFF